MKLYTALGISIGVLAGILCIICDLLSGTGISIISIAAWPGFIAWACYFAVGGKKEGLSKTLASNTLGAIMGFLIVWLTGPLSFLGGSISLAICVAIGSFILCVAANIDLLSFIPGSFCGCASCFGFHVGTDLSLLVTCILSLVVGALFAYASDIWGHKMAKEEA